MKQQNNELSGVVDAIKRHIEMENVETEDLLLKSGVSSAAVKSVPTLETIEREAFSCTQCSLSKTRTNLVFGSGNPNAKLMFVGEAPGMEEDMQGMPFVGRAGQLLTKIIQSIGLERKDVYIANILKCRPPKNRNPLPTEINACEHYLIRQIEIIKPKVICALGTFAAQTLLRNQEPISRLRGNFYDYHGSKLIPTFHPAYLLRNPSGKRPVWEDMKKIRRILQGSK